MNVTDVAVSALKPYEKNAKTHPDEQVERIAASLSEFGFKQPLVVDKDNVVVIGHGRLLAAKKLKMKTVPVVYADDLSDQQIKALRLADNKVAESEWDIELMTDDLLSITDLDMTEFGFELGDDSYDDEDDDFDDDPRSPSAQHNVFENQERMQFAAENYYGIPELQATDIVGDKMVRFCDWKEIENPEDYIAHFYYDDFKFISAWREPDKYIERLKRFKAVVSPDFSLYTDFPRALQILSCYRRNWCGAYWAINDINIIPDVVWGDETSFDYCFLGLPKHSTLAVSTVGVKNDENWNGAEGELFMAGYNEMMKRLEPTTVIFYGDMIEGCEGNIIHVPSFYAERREMLNEMKRIKDGQRK